MQRHQAAEDGMEATGGCRALSMARGQSFSELELQCFSELQHWALRFAELPHQFADIHAIVLWCKAKLEGYCVM
jgi:hypothetical protein